MGAISSISSVLNPGLVRILGNLLPWLGYNSISLLELLKEYDLEIENPHLWGTHHLIEGRKRVIAAPLSLNVTAIEWVACASILDHGRGTLHLDLHYHTIFEYQYEFCDPRTKCKLVPHTSEWPSFPTALAAAFPAWASVQAGPHLILICFLCCQLLLCSWYRTES